MNALENVEAEFKFRADDISRSDFDALAQTLKPIRSIRNNKENSIDYYFSRNSKFMRFRKSSKHWELTTKVKHDDNNNKVRTEVNINLGEGMSQEKAKAFSEVFGLKEDFAITKDVQVYWYEKIVLSHYTCFNESGDKLDTFLEIECLEEYPWESQEIALAELAVWEEKLSPLGISPYKRLRKSLFEFYTKLS